MNKVMKKLKIKIKNFIKVKKCEFAIWKFKQTFNVPQKRINDRVLPHNLVKYGITDHTGLRYNFCPKCYIRDTEKNIIERINGEVTEYETICKKCGFILEYYSYGCFID